MRRRIEGGNMCLFRDLCVCTGMYAVDDTTVIL